MNLFAVLRDAWFFYSRHFGFIARLCLPLILVEGVVHELVAKVTGVPVHVIRDLLVTLLFYPLYTGALILFLDARSQGFYPSPGRLLGLAFLRWPSFAVLAGISSLAVMLGASLFVLPGLWLMVKLAFSEFLLVQRGASPLQAIKGSFRLTAGQFLPVLGGVLLTVLPVWSLDLLLASALDAASNPLLAVAADGLVGLAQLFGTVVFFRLYMLILPAPNGRPVL